MFSLFSRRQTAPASPGKQAETASAPGSPAPAVPTSPTPNTTASPDRALEPEPQQLRTPSPSVSSQAHRGDPFAFPSLPSPPPAPEPTLSPTELQDLLRSVPAVTLHAYTLSHLPNAPPAISSALGTFFATLAPPPRFHCVRCHADYSEVENDARSCRVPHDDESAAVERVGLARSARRRGPGGVVSEGATFETVWGCCAKTVEGDGDQGPPDGWCYEGKHTTDVKRARFRADSTPHNDKLVSCLRRNCHNIRARLAGGSASARATGVPTSPAGTVDSATRKRARSTRVRKSVDLRERSDPEDEDAEGDSVSVAGSAGAGRGRTVIKGRAKGKAKAKGDGDGAETEGERKDKAKEARGRSKSRTRPPVSRAKSKTAKPRARVGTPSGPVTDGEAEADGREVEAPGPKKRRKVA